MSREEIFELWVNLAEQSRRNGSERWAEYCMQNAVQSR